jgi:hypothetical protein
MFYQFLDTAYLALLILAQYREMISTAHLIQPAQDIIVAMLNVVAEEVEHVNLIFRVPSNVFVQELRAGDKAAGLFSRFQLAGYKEQFRHGALLSG